MSRLLKKSLAAAGEDGVVAVIERQRNLDGAVLLEFGRAVARDLIAFVEAAPAEEHDGAAVFEFGGCLGGTEGELGPSVFCGSRRRLGRQDQDRRDLTDRPRQSASGLSAGILPGRSYRHRE